MPVAELEASLARRAPFELFERAVAAAMAAGAGVWSGTLWAWCDEASDVMVEVQRWRADAPADEALLLRLRAGTDPANPNMPGLNAQVIARRTADAWRVMDTVYIDRRHGAAPVDAAARDLLDRVSDASRHTAPWAPTSTFADWSPP